MTKSSTTPRFKSPSTVSRRAIMNIGNSPHPISLDPPSHIWTQVLIITYLRSCRLVLRCRQEARLRFGQLRSDVQVKLELLDNKHVQDVASQLQKLSKGLAEFYEDIHKLSKENANLFPVEVDLTDSAFIYEKSFEILPPDETTSDE